MAFQLAGQLEQRLVRQRLSLAGTDGQRPGGNQARHDGRRRRAKAVALGDLVPAVNQEPWRLHTDSVEGSADGLDDQVPFAPVEFTGPGPGHLHVQSAGQHLRLHRVVQAERQSE